MKQVWDPRRQMYRTERPKANWFTYVLMYFLAFLAGGTGGIFAAFRFSAESLPRSDRSGYNSGLAPQNYSDVAVWALIGGAIAMAVLAQFIWSKDED